MRRISALPILVFSFFSSLAIVIAILTTQFVLFSFSLGNFTGVAYTLVLVILFYLILILMYRLFLNFFPLQEGFIEENSKQEFIYNVYLLFYLIPFHPLIKSQLIPVSLMRVVYLLLGAKMGENSYCSGIILDPPLTFIGNNTLLGQDCILTSHVIEGQKLAHAAIRIGDNVTVGAKAVIMAGVTIKNNAIVGAGAVVTKGITIEEKEVWCGIPAKKIKTLL